MSQAIAFQSFHRGTGTSFLTANVAALMAAQGQRVCVIDADIQTPALHGLFGLEADDIGHSLNDYLLGLCSLEQTARSITARLGAPVSGEVFLIPSSPDARKLAFAQYEGYDLDTLRPDLDALAQTLKVDKVLIDTHSGLSEDTLLLIALADILAVVLRPDQRDYQGTGVTLDLARKLEVPNILLIVNDAPPLFDFVAIKKQVEQAYNAKVVSVLPHADEVLALEKGELVVLREPYLALTEALRLVAKAF